MRGDRIRRAMLPFAARAARWAGVDVVPRDFNSPVPDTRALTREDWERRSPMRGVALDPAAQLDFLERELAGFLGEFDPPAEARGDGTFHLRNQWYGSVDAEILYAMVRWLHPARVIELGSGFSTLVICEALAANEGAGARRARYEVHDPNWGTPVTGDLEQIGSIDRTRAQDVPESAFASLAAGDVLFVDTSHVVKLGSEVNRVVLEILPMLAPGVVVHFHDIWLPFEYHRALVEDLGLAWNEQYLLHAYLTGNDGWEILVAAQALVRDEATRLRGLVPSYDATTHPTSFWIRRR